MKLCLVLSTSAFLILGSCPKAYTIPGIEFEPPLKKQRLNSEGLAAVPKPRLENIINKLEEEDSSPTTAPQFEHTAIAVEMSKIIPASILEEIRQLWQRQAGELSQSDPFRGILQNSLSVTCKDFMTIEIERLKNQAPSPPNSPFEGILQNSTSSFTRW